MSTPYFQDVNLQDEKKEAIPAYVEGSDSEGEVKSFSALLEEGEFQPLQYSLRFRVEHAELNQNIEHHSDKTCRPQP